MNKTQSNQTELPLLASKFKRRKATARYDSFDKTTGVKMLAKTGGGGGGEKRFHQIKKIDSLGLNSAPSFPAIPRQLFRSRFRCCACIFPSKKIKKYPLSICFLSAPHSTHRRGSGAYRDLRPDRPVLALGSVQDRSPGG